MTNTSKSTLSITLPLAGAIGYYLYEKLMAFNKMCIHKTQQQVQEEAPSQEEMQPDVIETVPETQEYVDNNTNEEMLNYAQEEPMPLFENDMPNESYSETEVEAAMPEFNNEFSMQDAAFANHEFAPQQNAMTNEPNMIGENQFYQQDMQQGYPMNMDTQFQQDTTFAQPEMNAWDPTQQTNNFANDMFAQPTMMEQPQAFPNTMGDVPMEQPATTGPNPYDAYTPSEQPQQALENGQSFVMQPQQPQTNNENVGNNAADGQDYLMQNIATLHKVDENNKEAKEEFNSIMDFLNDF